MTELPAQPPTIDEAPDEAIAAVNRSDLVPRAPGAPGRRSRGALTGPSLLGLALLTVAVIVSRWLLSRDAGPLGSVADFLSAFASIFLGIFIEALPFLLLGVIASALIQIYVSDGLIARLLPRKAVPAAFVGAILGLVFPVCDCGVIPVSRRLLSKGAPLPTAIAFMLAGPVINPVVVVSTYIAFSSNPAIALSRFGLILIVAMSVGLVFSLHPRPNELLVAPSDRSNDHGHDHGHDHSHEFKGNRIVALTHVASDEFFEMGQYLVIGALLGATLQTLVPRSTLLAIGHDPVLSVLTLMVLAVVLSVCSTVDAFVALSLASTFSSGALLAFLAFGPMVDLKSILMYTTTLRRPALLLLIVLSAQLIFMIAAFVNLNVG